MSTIIDGSNGITTPTYGGTDTSEYLVPVTAFKNRIINGAMMIDQRNAGASVTLTNGADSFDVDRWKFYRDVGGTFTAQRSTTAPAGFTNSILVTASTGATPSAGQLNFIVQNIEGFNVADLGFGTASAQAVTVSFWVRSSITGTYAVTIANANTDRCYVTTITINSANTFEYKTVTIPGDTTGTWATDNTSGMRLYIDLGSGSNFNGTVNTWNASTKLRTSGSVTWGATTGATFYLTGVQLEKGSTATSFDYRPYTTELQLCQRYYYQLTGNTAPIGSGYNRTTSIFYAYCALPVAMRATPTLNAPNSAAYFSVEYGTAGSANVSTLTAYIGTTTTYFVTGTPATSITAGSGCVVFTNNSSSYLGFNAEL